MNEPTGETEGRDREEGPKKCPRSKEVVCDRSSWNLNNIGLKNIFVELVVNLAIVILLM
jgi:hypothetical protein